MRILLAATHRIRSFMLPMPIGLASIAAQMDDSHHELQVLDLMLGEQPDRDRASALFGFAPDLVALSIRNLDNRSYADLQYYLPRAKEFAAPCRKHSDAIVVVGGATFTVTPAAVFEYLDPDFGIFGEAGGDRSTRPTDGAEVLPKPRRRGVDRGVSYGPLLRAAKLDQRPFAFLARIVHEGP